MHWNVAPDALPISARLVQILDCWRTSKYHSNIGTFIELHWSLVKARIQKVLQLVDYLCNGESGPLENFLF